MEVTMEERQHKTAEMKGDTKEDSAIVWETPDSPITTHDFILQNGTRVVRPYFFEFICNVKKRWDKKIIANFLAEEFRMRPMGYYLKAVDTGRILVNGKTVKNGYVVRASQTISHFVHRHEPPVMGESVEILEISPDVITVCKPPSVPVHPCGQYRKNTVLGILEAEYNLRPLYPIHRLDRLVSGLLILARNSHTADRFRQEIEGGRINKSYIAKVKGVFPAEEVELHASVVYDPKEGKSMTVKECDKMEAKSPAGEALNQKSTDKGKEACTRFRRLSTDGVHSIVECTPLTGRTHQIRVHLQHLGHPIANDALYATNDPPKRSEAGTNAERAARLEVKLHNGTALDESGFKRRRIGDDCVYSTEAHSDDLMSSVDGQLPDDKVEDEKGSGLSHETHLPAACDYVGFVEDPLCAHCPNLLPSGYEGKEQGLWLHCKSYSSSGWQYECPLPCWAKEPS